MKVLVTGGLGFIGSHTCVQFLEAGHEVLIFDNLSNSYLVTLDAIRNLQNGTISFKKIDIFCRNIMKTLKTKSINISLVK